MKASGIVRKIDELGRIVLPIELRRVMRLSAGDSMEIFTEKDFIMIRKYQESCIFCSETRHLTNFQGKYICRSCVAQLMDMDCNNASN